MSTNIFAQGENFFNARRDLSSSLVNHVFQDDNGLVWICTENGLNIYDGVKFWHIYHHDDDSLSLLNNYCRFVYQDSKSTLFVATIHGLQIFNKATQAYREVLVKDDNGSLQRSFLSVSSICELGDNRYVVGTSGHGLYEMLPDSISHKLVLRRRNVSGNLYVEKMCPDNKGGFWVSYLNYGLQHLDSHFNILEEIPLKHSESSYALECSPYGDIFFGTSHGRVLVYDKSVPSLCREIVSPQQNKYSVSDFFFCDNGDIYFATDGNGVKVLTSVEAGVYALGDYEFYSLDNSKLKVHSMMRDMDGNMWFGCFQRGVALKPANKAIFEYIGKYSHRNNVIGECCVMSLNCDSEHNFAVGTDNDGIYVLDENYRFIRHHKADEPGSLVPRVTLSMMEDSHGTIWVGGYLEGLVSYNLKANKWARFPLPNSNNAENLPSVYSIVEDKEGDALWVSASGVGLYKIDLSTRKTTLFAMKDEINTKDLTIDQIPNSWINSMMISSDRKLYFGTFQGFGCLDLSTESFVDTYGINCMLPNHVVNSIYEDSRHHIWLGTTEGLFDFDVFNRTFRQYGTQDGLSSNSISAIVGDSEDNIWMSSKGGISCLDTKSESIVNYYPSDGLYGTEFQQNSVFKWPNGKVSFGSVEGVVSFFPFKGRIRRSKLKVAVVNFVVNNIPMAYGSMSGSNMVMDTSVFHAKNFHLAHFDNNFDVVFSSMQFDNPESMTYSYSLDDGPWTIMTGSRVSFANMDYGVHKLQARVTDNISTSDVLTVYVEIDYPWYKSLWFNILVILFLLLVLAMLLITARRRYLLREKIKEMSHIKDINDSRLEFFTNISHEIRTPMSLIISPLYKLMTTDQDPDHQRSYKTINVNAQRILNLVNQLLDLRKIDNAQLSLKFQKVDVVQFMKGVYESFEEHAQRLGIDFTFSSQEPSLEAYIDPMNFDKVTVNLLSNAFKYTPKGCHVKVELDKISDTQYRIDFSDNGTGLQENDIEHIFELFYQGDNSHKIGIVGTGVGMYLSRQLVEMHGGHISVANNTPDKGCTFSVVMPLGRAHLQDSQIVETEEILRGESSPSPLPNMVAPPIDDEFLKQYAKTKFRIMVVDDDEQIRNYIVQELGAYFHVTDFSNAEDAWKSVVTNKPDLIVSDLMMGQMSGIMFCKKIKQNLEVNHIPVILLTGMAQDDNRIKSLDVGADAFLAKPFNISVLVHTITNLLKKNITLKNRYLGHQEHSKKVDSLDIKSPDERLLQRVMKVINENISNPGLTVEMIASEVGISRVHLHRKLKELTNQSTLDFLRNVRLNLAVKLLEKHHHSILEVAQQVGFVSTAYFSTVFKDRFGVTPTAYMNEHSGGQPIPES